jgi:GGDEF domain-containing protein
MLTGPPRRRRARPVADAPIDSLLSKSEDLAKGWLLALLERVPLDEAPRIMATDLTRDGPRVCEAMLRALATDTDERRLEPDGALAPLAGRIGELAGASGAEATAHAVDALQAVIWAALRAELQAPDPDLITALVERLAQVTELMRAAALRHDEGVAHSALTAVAPGVRDPLVADRALEDLRVARREPDSAPLPPPVAGRAPETDAAIRAWVSGESADEALWVGALQDEITRSGGAPLSLVLAELEDAAQLVAVENTRMATATFGEFAKAVRGAVRRQDFLFCETDARAWVIARDTDRTGAQVLGSRISFAVRQREQWRGAPMVASVGVAVLGEDGRSPSELIEAAEEARFAAAAAGVEIVRDDEQPGER